MSKTVVTCSKCGKNRLVETNGMSKSTYEKRSPCCHKCGYNKKSLSTSFKIGNKSWAKGTKGIIKIWNKGLKGIHLSPRTEFKYKNGSGYRSVLIRENLLRECFFCGENNIKRLHVHHIDLDRSNNNRDNLLVICRPCHLSIHGHKERHYVEGRRAING